MLFLGYNLELFRVDAFSYIFGIIFLIAIAVANLYSIGANTGKIEPSASMIYAGSAMLNFWAIFDGKIVDIKPPSIRKIPGLIVRMRLSITVIIVLISHKK